MDPGNWGTDLQGGARFQYDLLWVVGLASLMAIFMQVMAARLGVVTGKDLAQCCRDWYPGWTRWPNWLLSELAIGACDLAEVLGSAVALNLMFHIPLLWAVMITAADVFHAPGFGDGSRHVNDGGKRFDRRRGAKLFHIVHAILHAEDHRAGSKQRSQRARRGRVVRCFHTKKNNFRAANRA